MSSFAQQRLLYWTKMSAFAARSSKPRWGQAAPSKRSKRCSKSTLSMRRCCRTTSKTKRRKKRSSKRSCEERFLNVFNAFEGV